MTSRYVLIIILSLFGFSSFAQDADSIFAVRKGPNLAIRYYLKKRENIAMIANRFYTTQEKIEGMSGVDGRKPLPVGTMLFIPATSENFVASRQPAGMVHQEEVYYRVGERDDIALVSMYAGIKKQELILWNSLHGNTLKEGQILFIGWVKMVPKDTINLANGLAYPSGKKFRTIDTSKHAYGELDSLYNIQTRNGTSTISEKGTAVFFEKAGNNKVYFAFHNTTARGAVIKVTNPGTGKTIYAKVLGTIPDTKQYAGCIIGISNAAKEALDINDNKAWCELTYSPN